LRALCRWAQLPGGLGKGGREIGYGGTKEKEWKLAGHKATFRFTEGRFLERFEQKANEVLRPDLWKKVGDSRDNDPATKQR
jgi:hypothetical protein